MNRATPQIRNLAKRLINDETTGNDYAGMKIPEAVYAGERLRPHLTALMGNGGFRALLSRALALANAEIPWLRAVHVKADGSLEGLEELRAQLSPAELLEGRVALLAQLIGLLEAFIGEDLTSRLVRDIWPNVRPSDSKIDKRKGNYENSK
jgi:hypothetical protein